MKTKLTADGEVTIPPEVRQHDHLEAGDEFDLDRVASGHYLLTKLQRQLQDFSIGTEHDGLPVIRGSGGTITSEMVKEIESQSP